MSAPTLVCFAVEQEARPFQRQLVFRTDIRVLVTGMGTRHAQQAIARALASERPALVLTCGFAGALAPALQVGDVVFDVADAALAIRLHAAGARSAKFHCSPAVLTTSAGKRAARERTGCDAVDMESVVIRAACEQAGIPSATIRAISDAANEDMPLDFNALLTPDMRMSGQKLALALLKSPQKIPALIRLGRHSAMAARELARVLLAVT
jgi:nucleoside phosphorylase